MTVEIKLKNKYLVGGKSRYGSGHNFGAKREKRAGGGTTTIVYNPRNHVLVILGKGRRVFYHYEEARRILGD